jgi:putative oxidoreductase
VAERRFERRGEFRHFEPLRKRHPNDHLNKEEGLMFGSQERKINFGLLIMRVGLAAVLLIHSLPELFGGTHNWQSVGTTLNILNIGVPQTPLGLIILLLEALGAVSLVFGYFFRTACTILFLFFGLNFFYYFSIGYQNLMLWSAGIATVFLGLIYVGPGRYAIAVKLEKK